MGLCHSDELEVFASAGFRMRLVGLLLCASCCRLSDPAMQCLQLSCCQEMVLCQMGLLGRKLGDLMLLQQGHVLQGCMVLAEVAAARMLSESLGDHTAAALSLEPGVLE